MPTSPPLLRLCAGLAGFAALGLSAPARAATATTGLIAPSTTVPAGKAVRVELMIFNSTDRPQSYSLPREFDGHILQGTQVWLVTMHNSTGDAAVPAGGFARVPLAFSIPLGARGQAVLEINQPGLARAPLDIGHENPAAIAPADSGALENETSSITDELPAANRLKRYYADRFTLHEPTYFVFGGEKPAAKFQLSFKYRLLNDRGPLARRAPLLRGLHFGYTQRSVWDITSDSSPFYDSSYLPELLFESLARDTGRHSGFTWLGYHVGVQHESNGRSGDDSRSLNTFYVRPAFAFGDLDGWRLILRPKFFVYLGSSSDNDDIRKYRGYSELRAIFGRNNRLSLSLTGRIGADFEKGSAQFDLSYPTEFLTGNLAVYLLAQYWTGYGESLLSYDRRSSTVRFGFSLAR